MESKSKRDEFKNRLKHEDNNKKMIIAGTAITLVAGTISAGFAIENNIKKPLDMSKYNIDNTKYEDYIRESGDKESEISDKLYRMAMLEENIRIYKELNEGNLTNAQKESLEIAKNSIKREMSSSMLNKIYLNDIFKEKIMEVYDADYVKVNYDMAKGEEFMNVELYKGINNKVGQLDKKDMIKEIKSAIKDIVSLQNLQEKDDSYNENDINKFIKAYENMKGFSNLTFIKEDDKPLSVEENALVNFADGKYTVYNVNIDDEKNVNITGKRDIEVKDNKIISDGEER